MSDRCLCAPHQVWASDRAVWLRDRLRDAFPWLIVPALPEKSALNKTQLLASGKADEEFQEVRLRALQRWLERVALHPQLSGSGACAGGG